MERTINADELLSFARAIKTESNKDVLEKIEGYIASHCYPPLDRYCEGVKILKEYVLLKEGLHDYVYIHTENEVIKTNISWYSGSITVINKFAKDGWKVVGYERYSVLMEREIQN